MPTAPNSSKQSTHPKTVWVHNHVVLRTVGNNAIIDGGFVILYYQDKLDGQIDGVTASVHPGLCEVPLAAWTRGGGGSGKSATIGGRKLEIVDLSKLSGASLVDAVESTADKATLKVLAAMSGKIGELAADVIRTWRSKERSYKRQVVGSLASFSRAA